MPAYNNTSPIKRSAASQEALSDQAVLTRQSPTGTAPIQKSAKPHRQHFVSHRPHARNPSFKNLNKVQRLAVAHNLQGDNEPPPPPNGRHHQRKKSAPASPATSPKANQHVRWNGSVISLGPQGGANVSMRKNLSTPVLRRNVSGGILTKKNHPLNQPGTEKKKSVGFELAGSDDDDDEWEDNSSYSPDSTRRNSVITGKMNGEESPRPQTPSTARSQLAQVNNAWETKSLPGEPAPEPSHHADHDDITGRLLQRPQVSKAPPAISSISATAIPPAADRSPRAFSFGNFPSSQGLNGRETTAPSPSGNGGNPQATSSSAEGGVSRFLSNSNAGEVRSDSDPATPSSFLPHYHPHIHPSPDATIPKRSRSRNRAGEPPSRTQQKLWLQRTAVLATSPPDHPMAGPASSISPSVVEPGFMTGNNSRSGPNMYGHDGRRVISSGMVSGAITPDSEAKRARKIYERYSAEYSVVRKFREPISDSFGRVDKLSRTEKAGRGHINAQLMNGHVEQQSPGSSRPSTAATRNAYSDRTLNQRFPNKTSRLSNQLRFQNQYNPGANDSEEPSERLDVEHQHRQPGTGSNVHSDSNMYDEQLDDGPDDDANHPNEEEMLLRRMWDSREVAVPGD